MYEKIQELQNKVDKTKDVKERKKLFREIRKLKIGLTVEK